jgi:Zn finger protein HypA/HybF involved in hydrogenase expression
MITYELECKRCGKEFLANRQDASCPNCGGDDHKVNDIHNSF